MMISPLNELVAHGVRTGIYDLPFGFGHLNNSSSCGGGTFTGRHDFESEAITNPTSAFVPQQTNDDGPSNKFECISHEPGENSRSDPERGQRPHKKQRRLAQNREAARKSRLRKKAYVQQLESSRLKLAQLEHELNKTTHQGVYRGNGTDIGRFGFSRPINSGITTFDIEYTYWVEEQRRKDSELWKAMHVQAGEIELRMLVDSHLKHYEQLFRMKTDAAKVDVFYIMSGTWRTSAERLFLWIGGFRPSELLNVLMPQIEPMSDQQLLDVYNLKRSCQQAEDALSQGMDKLQQNLAHEVTADQIGRGGNYRAQIAAAMEKLEAWENFVNQADHLRQQTMRRMARILTTHQAARALLGLGDYFDRLRALSLLWATRPHDATKVLAFLDVLVGGLGGFGRHGRVEDVRGKGQRRTIVRAAKWGEEKSPYETLELERDADEEKIKVVYRRLAKFYHPDVYDGRGTLEKGESAEARFIKIQAAYELLMDEEKRRQYDLDNRVNPMKASQAWMEWLMKMRKAFDQCGDMAIAAWAEQRQQEMNLRARHLSRSKVDPEEERRLLAKEKKVSKEYFNNTLKRHTLVLKKRDLMRKKAEEDKKKVISQLLALEGLELDTDDETQ